MIRRLRRSTLFPYTTLFRSNEVQRSEGHTQPQQPSEKKRPPPHPRQRSAGDSAADEEQCCSEAESSESEEPLGEMLERDRKSTRLNSSHLVISYAVFCLKKT